MAFNPAPSNWVTGWSVDAGNLVIPISSFPELTSSEADGTTGDIRKSLFAVLTELSNQWYATAEADRPVKMEIFRSVSVNSATGVNTVLMTFQFQTAVASQEVVDEA